MMVDIDDNLMSFCADRAPGARYASFDYCYNHFQDARERGVIEQLGDGVNLQVSCLQLGFYLASWGMMRGSSQLLQRSLRELVPVVEAIAQEPDSTWKLDVPDYDEDVDSVLALCGRIRRAFTITASDILVTKTVLGVFGCVPAFDRYFQIGFECSALSGPALKRISAFYSEHEPRLSSVDIRTLDFFSGMNTMRRYPRAKLIDMVFFQEGVNRSRAGSPNLSSRIPEG
jgi:hypothetical protein